MLPRRSVQLDMPERAKYRLLFSAVPIGILAGLKERLARFPQVTLPLMEKALGLPQNPATPF